MKKKLTCMIGLMAVLLAACFLLTGCGSGKPEDEKLIDRGFRNKVTFDANGGLMGSVEIKILFVKDDSLVAPPGEAGLSEAILADHTLEGWYHGEKESDGTVTLTGEKWNFERDKVHDSFTLYAQWQRNFTFRVLVDGAVKETRIVQPGGTADGFATPKRAGYTFLGFYADEECTKEWNDTYAHPGDPAHPDVYVYTKWLEGEYVMASSADDFKGMNASSKFYLLNDIDFTDATWKFLPGFAGEIKGNGHVIRNVSMTVTSAGSTYYGLFGELSNAKLSDVTFEDCTVNFTFGVVKGNSMRYFGFMGYLSGATTLKNVRLTRCAMNVDLSQCSNKTVFIEPDAPYLTVRKVGEEPLEADLTGDVVCTFVREKAA